MDNTFFKPNPTEPVQSNLHPTEPVEIQVEDDRTGMTVETLKRAFADNLYYIQGKNEYLATPHDYYMALAYTVRDRLLYRWINTTTTYLQNDVKTVYYLSAEFLMGRQLDNNLLNLGLYERARQAVKESGLDLSDLRNLEAEPGLGNGGLGRLAACFLDSLATLAIPAVGYGIRYEFGIFDQRIEEGVQVEHPDKWLRFGNPWEIRHPELTVEVMFGGHTEGYHDEKGRYRVRWMPERKIMGMPYDTPVPGYHNNTVNTLRLWRAGASEEFDFQVFDSGDYAGAVTGKIFSENISKVLYPNDNTSQGKQLRLEQQYFFVSCSLQDIINNYRRTHGNFDNFHEKVAIQLNDTHPSIGIAELMRLLVDKYDIGWNRAWYITKNTFAYTNHTLLAEALERWPVSLFQSLLPRHLEIIYEINHRFLEQVRAKYPNDPERVSRMSLIEEGSQQFIRMAHLACIGCHSINGVAALHTELLKHRVLRDFYDFLPERFNNKTNGVTPRRWILLSNPQLSELITEKIGKTWVTHLEELQKLEAFVDDPEFRRRFWSIKQEHKQELVDYILLFNDVEVDPNSLFDVQVKRLHEYKRQLLNVLYIITLYNRIKRNPGLQILPRTFIFAGKAAPGYFMAKLIIRLINAVAKVVNNDTDVADRLKVVFVEGFSVSLGQKIYPAANLSEQISTAGKEASGTGNMKFALNGALTIGTLDGANIEIREVVGNDNFFLFGLTDEEVFDLKAKGYQPLDYYNNNAQLKEVIDRIAAGDFSDGNREVFKPIVDSLLYHDEYLLLADYQSYIDCQERVSQAYRDQDNWIRMSILNTARMGKFSSDRTIRQYCQEIWNVEPVKIELDDYDQDAAGLKVLNSPRQA
ncbi:MULTISPECIES: glycogen/starch/alpha-glucan phosphorylase [unclassified Coleofasciculus]|uniref:glycogen/starch/alpha-glucan phosphorylase n=1 Tax=unclassified Coleofasciculus TaxID=2692782 RepID=UPI001881E4A2|nr:MULTISPECIES: glycogen/starch/alpha-glucan phosphorylase [unclassified Coleofasciculus]MBE9125181.1 glycogen/starch/alpha-glucan phosphorylase [Coleofasciculus sp. LEGE 07081]MBE9148758.1 glycogen/starch/alpha-glucan phosphorylase [Coleofasciculus sp. LEGE 07092]